MAEFVKADGSVIQPRVIVDEGEGIVGYLTNVTTHMNHSTMEHTIDLTIAVNQKNLEIAGGFVPNLGRGGKIQIKAIR